MSKQAAVLQTYNQELVQNIEQLRNQRNKIDALMEKDEHEKIQLSKEIDILSSKLRAIHERMSKNMATKNELDKTISDAETGLDKIIESSKIILQAVKNETKSYKLL